MRRINVNAYEKALIFKNGKLVNVLSEGKHWIGFNQKVRMYDVTELFYHEIELDLLLQNSQFADAVDVIRIADSEIMIEYKDGNFKQVLTPGVYCYWNEGIRYTYNRVDLDDIEVSRTINRKVLQLPAVAKYLTAHIVESYEKGLLYIDGVLSKELPPGMYYYWKGQKNAIVKKVDLRKQQVEISGQELLTKDKAALRLNFYAYYKVHDIVRVLDSVKDYARQLYFIVQLGLREYVGQYTLDELLANKTGATPYIMKYAGTKVTEMGVTLMDCGIRDIILPGDVKDIMNQVLIAEKKAQANVIMRREETASTRSLLNTAKLMGEITVNGGTQVMDQLRGMMSYKS